MNFETLLNYVIPDPTSSLAAVEALRTAHPGLTPLELAYVAVRSAKIRAATAGAATGMASTPLTMIPAALADMGAVLKIEGSLVGVIAALLDPAYLKDPKALKADVIGVIFPAAASQALRQVGIRAGERITQAAMRKYATEDMVRTIVKFVTRYLGKQLTREAVLTKAVPFIGVGIGAGWNWLEVQAIGARAIRYYTEEAVAPASNGSKPPASHRLWPKVSRFLP